MKTLSIFILFLTISNISFAKVFSVKKTSTRTQYDCPFSRGGCFVDELEDMAKDKCYSSGFNYCTTIQKSTNYGKGGLGICGNYRKWICVVRVRGTK